MCVFSASGCVRMCIYSGTSSCEHVLARELSSHPLQLRIMGNKSLLCSLGAPNTFCEFSYDAPRQGKVNTHRIRDGKAFGLKILPF